MFRQPPPPCRKSSTPLRGSEASLGSNTSTDVLWSKIEWATKQRLQTDVILASKGDTAMAVSVLSTSA